MNILYYVPTSINIKYAFIKILINIAELFTKNVFVIQKNK